MPTNNNNKSQDILYGGGSVSNPVLTPNVSTLDPTTYAANGYGGVVSTNGAYNG